MILIDFFFSFFFFPRDFFSPFFFYILFTTPYRSCVAGPVVCVFDPTRSCVYSFYPSTQTAERDFRLVSRLHVTSGGVRQSGGISNGPQHDGSNPSRHDPLQELNQIDPHPPKTIRVSLKWKTQKKKFSTKG